MTLKLLNSVFASPSRVKMWSGGEFPGATARNDLSEPIRFDKFDRDEERFPVFVRSPPCNLD